MPAPAALVRSTTIESTLEAAQETLDTVGNALRAMRECIEQSRRCLAESRLSLDRVYASARRCDGSRL